MGNFQSATFRKFRDFAPLHVTGFYGRDNTYNYNYCKGGGSRSELELFSPLMKTSASILIVLFFFDGN
jgi:hypothetical protein